MSMQMKEKIYNCEKAGQKDLQNYISICDFYKKWFPILNISNQLFFDAAFRAQGTDLKPLDLTQWAKSPKNSRKRCDFVNSALKIQCHIAKNALLQTAFLANLPIEEYQV